jgi:hypothetical protein
MAWIALAARINLAAPSQHLSSKLRYALGIKHIFIPPGRDYSASVHEGSAVRMQNLPGHVGRIVGCKKQETRAISHQTIFFGRFGHGFAGPNLFTARGCTPP